jgi:hypothetical protein
MKRSFRNYVEARLDQSKSEKLTKNQRDQIKNMIQNGQAAEDIAFAVGVSPQTIQNIMNKGDASTDIYSRTYKTSAPKYKASYNKYQPNQQEIDRIIQLGREGHRPDGIALMLGDELGKVVPIHMIKSILNQNNISPGRSPEEDFKDVDSFSDDPELKQFATRKQAEEEGERRLDRRVKTWDKSYNPEQDTIMDKTYLTNLGNELKQKLQQQSGTPLMSSSGAERSINRFLMQHQKQLADKKQPIMNLLRNTKLGFGAVWDGIKKLVSGPPILNKVAPSDLPEHPAKRWARTTPYNGPRPY